MARARRYEEARAARFTVENVGGAQRFTVVSPRSLLAAGVLAVAVAVMAVVAVAGVWGMAVIPSVLGPPLPGADRYLPATLYACAAVVALSGAFALCILVSTLLWTLGGAEVVEVAGGDLSITHRMPGFARTRHYRGGDVTDLVGHDTSTSRQGGGLYPWAAGTGSVRFTYGARTVYLAGSLDAAEGRLLAAALRESLLAGGARPVRHDAL